MSEAILVTGGAGYIGSHSAFLLAQHQYRVIVLDSFVHHQYFNPPWATVIKGDIADKNLLATIFTTYQIKAVMHFAGSIEVGQSVKTPLLFYDNNVSKTLVLLETMLEHEITTFIFSSSCAVYGVPEQMPILEEHPCKPINPYGTSKSVIESVLRDCYNAYGLRSVSLRYFNAAGALPSEHLGEQHKPETHIIPLLLRAMRDHTPFVMYGNDYPTKDGTAVRDYVHVLDIADAHVKALEHLKQGYPSDHFNLGTGHGFSVREMIKTVEQLCNVPIKTVISKARAGDPAILIADSSKAQAILRWKPRYSTLEYMIKSAYCYENLWYHRRDLEHYL